MVSCHDGDMDSGVEIHWGETNPDLNKDRLESSEEEETSELNVEGRDEGKESRKKQRPGGAKRDKAGPRTSKSV